jgi:peptidoglycan/LPS O-acetylase OafA/YrhL
MPTQKVYFPALDSLRAIAMLLVFLAHAAPVMKLGGLDIGWPDWGNLGRTGLILFFILSGFLITWLLLQEKQDRQRIDIGHFYMRRILRIWPLYYLIIGICQFLIPYTRLPAFAGIYPSTVGNFGRTALCYLLFLPNIAFLLVKPGNPFLTHIWSIGVEEQFYLIWPWILQRCGKYLAVVLWVLIGLTLLSSWSYEYWFPYHRDKKEIWGMLSQVNATVYWSNIGYFAIGGLIAYFGRTRPRAGKFLAGIGRLQHPLLTWLGKISYGMYIFHVLVTMITARLLLKAGMPQRHPAYGLLALVLAFGLTALTGTLSYGFVESFFLRLKKRFS